MSRETTYAGMLGDLERLIAALENNAFDLPELEGVRLHLQQLLNVTLEALQEQAALIASKQQASLRVLRLIGDGQRVVTAARKMLKAHYGLNAEKLAEFGVQPFRGRRRQADPGLPVPEIAQPADEPDSTSPEI
jgi:hypothetical protein